MSFGKPAAPTPQPEVKAPTPDDPASVEAQRKTAARVQSQQGASAYLLSGEKGVSTPSGTEEKSLLGVQPSAKTF